MGTVDRIVKLMEEHNTTAAQLTREISLTNGLITQWKSHKQKPSTDAIIKLANYYNVSTDYLLTGKENSFSLSVEDSAWLDLLHEVPPKKRSTCFTYMQGFIAGFHTADK